MVHALRDGRKTQTRRLMKDDYHGCLTGDCPHEKQTECDAELQSICPWGKPGDLIWVRESYALGRGYDGIAPSAIPQDDYVKIHYLADGKKPEWCGMSRPSIFLMQWMSRITLEITDVHVARLQDITEDQAVAEGLKRITKDGELFKYGIPDLDGLPGTDNVGWPWVDWCLTAYAAFKTLWWKIHGEAAWKENPWVWVISFKVHEINIKDFLRGGKI